MSIFSYDAPITKKDFYRPSVRPVHLYWSRKMDQLKKKWLRFFRVVSILVSTLLATHCVYA